MTPMRLVQLQNGNLRRTAIVQEPQLCFLREFESVYALAQAAIESGGQMTALATARLSDEQVDYDLVYADKSDWKLLAPVDHPHETARCLVSGTGLTHLGSARDRAAMHAVKKKELSDSMKMFRWGLESGRPAAGEIGIAPEWFYKGDGSMVRAQDEPLIVPPYAEDGGEEAEIAVAYLIGPGGQPYRLGMTQGNEFSDHVFEKKNYLNLAGSKLRTCAIGPELVIDPVFASIPGTVRLERGGKTFWSQEIASGEQEMSHSLRNLEHHHFKFELHRRPGDVHIHFLGAASLSFGQGIQLEDGDFMEVHFDNFGRPLRNPLQRIRKQPSLVEAISLT